MRTRTTIALFALAGLTIAACGSDESEEVLRRHPGPPAVLSRPKNSTGATFVSTEVTGYDLVEGTEITIIFLADFMSVSGGCNSMSGGFEIGEGLSSPDPSRRR